MITKYREIGLYLLFDRIKTKRINSLSKLQYKLNISDILDTLNDY